MDDESLAESLKLRANIFPDGRILESRIKRGQDVENSVWQREKTLAHPPADNVFLYKSTQRDFRVVKQIRWQDEIANYRRELHMMERVLKEVEPHQRELFVDFIGWFPSQDYIHFVLEYCPYGDISQQQIPMAEVDAWCICNQLMEGLSVLHKVGIIHRDIKPQNVLVSGIEPIRVKIADFGISKIAHKDDAQTNKHPTTRIGTPGYMAPERLGLIESISSSHTPAIDIWSLGCLIHYILTGTIPFTAQNSPTPNSYAALEDYCTGARGLSEDHLAKHRISLSGRSFLRRLLAPNPQDRPVASRELMIDWEFPPSISNGTTLTTERSNGSVPASNLNTSQELFYVDQYSQGFVTELEMNLPSSELWYLIKSEKDGRLNRDRLQILLLSHANPNIFFKGYTALHVAAETGSAESIGELIRYGADPKIRTKTSQETAIHLAATQGDPETFKNKIEVLLESDIDIDARNFEGDTALHLAICRIGTVDAVEILLGKGACLESKGRHGRTPLQYAMFLEKEEIATALLNHKANIYCEDEAGVTPLHLAVSGKTSLSLIERLIGDSSHINHENDAHETPLFAAATCKRWDVMRLLIEHGAECKPHSAALESRLTKAQRRPFLDMRIPWIS